MRTVFGIASLFVITLFSGNASAQLGPVIGSYGNWDIRRSSDLMSDAKSCFATLKGNTGVQLTKAALHVTVRGGPEGFEYRFDEDPKSGMTLVGDILRKVGAIEFSGQSFNRAIRANRLRAVVVTLISGSQQFDLDLSGIGTAYSAVYHCR